MPCPGTWGVDRVAQGPECTRAHEHPSSDIGAMRSICAGCTRANSLAPAFARAHTHTNVSFGGYCAAATAAAAASKCDVMIILINDPIKDRDSTAGRAGIRGYPPGPGSWWWPCGGIRIRVYVFNFGKLHKIYYRHTHTHTHSQYIYLNSSHYSCLRLSAFAANTVQFLCCV